jgi:GDP-L-fucose synthase
VKWRWLTLNSPGATNSSGATDFLLMTITSRSTAQRIDATSRIFVAGHRGLVGSAIARRLQARGFESLLLRTRAELDLLDGVAVRRFFERERPDAVVLAAAKVGGIIANRDMPAEFIHQNLVIQTNVLHEAWRAKTGRVLFLGSSCIYPRECPQPMKESHLLTGPLEPTNSAYAVAKIAGIEMCRAYNHQYGTRFLAAMPTNMYGPGDNFDLQTSHVLPALVRKFVEAVESNSAEVVVWGSGEPRREFLHSDDLADACVTLLTLTNDALDRLIASHYYPLVNIGFGDDVTIRELAELIARVTEFRGRLVFDRSRPDGTHRKLMDSTRMRALGWAPRISLEQGVAQVVESFRQQRRNAGGVTA